MVTVTLPIRTAVAPQPERLPLPASEDTRADGFGAVFAMLGSDSPSPDRAVPKLPETATKTDRPTEDPPAEATNAPVSDARVDAGPEAIPLAVPIVPAPPLQAPLPVVARFAEAVSIASVPFSGNQTPGTIQPGAEIEPPVPALPTVPALPPVPAQHLAPFQPPAPTEPPAPIQPPAQSQPLVPATFGAIALPTLAEPAPSTDPGVIFSATVPVAAQGALLMTARPVGGEGTLGDALLAQGQTAETGLFELTEVPATATRAAALPAGMPAFWAAREAATTAPASAQDPAPTNDAPATTAPDAPRPVALKPLEVKPTSDGVASSQGAEVFALEEPRTVIASSAPPTLGPGQSQAISVQTLPQTTYASTSAPTMPPQLPAQIAAAVAARPERPLELRLAPVELGGLSLNLRQDGDILRVVLQADRPETLDLLRRNGEILLEELRLAGFTGASLSFGEDGGAQDRQTRAPTHSVPSADLPAGSVPGPAYAPVPSAQGLDLRL